MTKVQLKGLRLLARLYGVQTKFVDSAGRRQEPSPETLLGVLKAMGAPVGGPGDVAEATRARRAELRSRRIEPVHVAWDDATPAATLRLPASSPSRRLDCLLTLEDGDERRWVVAVDDLGRDGFARAEGGPLVGRRLRCQGRCRRAITGSGSSSGPEVLESLVIAAPARAFRGRARPTTSPGGSSARCMRCTGRRAGGRGTSPTSRP